MNNKRVKHQHDMIILASQRYKSDNIDVIFSKFFFASLDAVRKNEWNFGNPDTKLDKIDTYVFYIFF